MSVAPITKVQPTDKPTVFPFFNEDIANPRGIAPDRHGVDLSLPSTEDLTGRVKVYLSGGENTMHKHPKEDHAFYVLSGQATFHIETDENAFNVAAFEGILLPKGTSYWFTNTGEGNLVMLRVGSSMKDTSYRLLANGELTPNGEHNFRHEAGRSIV